MMKIFFTIGAILLMGIVLFGFQKINAKQLKQKEKSSLMKTEPKNSKTATFAGGCFWCVESDFEKEGFCNVGVKNFRGRLIVEI